MSVLIKKAVETAEMFECPIEAIYVETNYHYGLDEKSILQLKKNLNKTNDAGIVTHHVTGVSVYNTILQYAQENKFNKIFLGTSPKNLFVRIFNPSLHHLLTQNNSSIEVITTPLPKNTRKNKILSMLTTRQSWIGYLSSSIIIALIVLATRLLEMNSELIGYNPALRDHVMIILIGVLFCSVRFGTLPGLLASVLGYLSISYFFISPISDFSVEQNTDFVSLIILLLAGIIASTFGGLSREQIRNLRLRDAQAQAAIRLNEVITNISSEDEAIERLQTELSSITNTNIIIFLLDADKVVRKQSKEMTGFSLDDRKHLLDVIESEVPSRITLSDKASFHFEPIITDSVMQGVLAIEEKKSMARHISRLYESLAKQCGLVLKNVNVASVIETSKIRAEREQLRSALLSSVSHDLKTPLASIIGSLSAIKQMGKNLSPEASEELLTTALEEAERLNGFISNILNMTKLESKAVDLNMKWLNFEDIVIQVIKTLKFRAKNHKIIFEKPEKEIDLYVDRMLFSQVLQNIIDNALKYSPEQSEVTISIEVNEEQDFVEISIADEGTGILEKDREKVFDKFSRLNKKDHKIAGTGLGLAICKIIIDQHNGEILIEDNKKAKNTGSVFKIKLSKYKLL
jgi:two-component system sensor histidine kinase KdpD